jgi:hypothetical protein
MKNWARSDILYFLVMLVFISITVWVHLAAGFTFPVPWPDEAVFVQQAISFQQHNSLFSPNLSDSRHILWMPPGYIVLLGMLFKICGSSLFVARFFSLALTIASFVLLVWLLREHPARLHFLFLTGLFFLNRFFVVTANIARMEPLLILGIVGAIVLFYNRKSGTALTVLLALPLIHPNGFYFLCAGIAFVLVQRLYLKEEVRYSSSDKWILALVLVLIAGYVAYAALHWSDFLRDMSFQFARKNKRNLIAPFRTYGSLAFVCVSMIAVIAALARKEGKLILFSLFACAFWFVNKIGQEMWYQVFDVIAFLLLTIVLIQLLNPARKTIIYTVLVLLSVYVSIQLDMVERIKGYPYSLVWYTMRFPAQVDYFNNDDAVKIGDLLISHQKGSEPLRAMVYPNADALFLRDLEGKVLRSIYIAQDTSVFPAQKRDLYLVHISRYSPLGFDWLLLPWVLEDAKIDTSDKKNLLFERDGTEQWYYRFVSSTPDTMQTRKYITPPTKQSCHPSVARHPAGEPADQRRVRVR